MDAIWLHAAATLGWKVERSPHAYASWDGAGTLSLAPACDLDPDDCLAQMIFHEICHALVAGSTAWTRPDWGLDNASDRDVEQEHATNRLQAALAAPYGLRRFMAVTTDFRGYYDALPDDPLRDDGAPSVPLAARGRERAEREPYKTALDRALEATAQLAHVARRHAAEDSLWRLARARHRTGLLMPDDGAAAASCGSCAWSYRDDSALRCRQARRGDEPGVRVAFDEAACERWEAAFSDEACGGCGACCRQGFDLVPVDPGDLILERRAELVERSTLGAVLLRPGGFCVALDGDGEAHSPYRCRYYAERPTSCREFEVRGDACLLARRRVGLSL